MPYIDIKITDESVSRGEKKALIQGATQLMVDVLNKDPAATFVVITEVPTANWGVAGEPVDELRARRDLRED